MLDALVTAIYLAICILGTILSLKSGYRYATGDISMRSPGVNLFYLLVAAGVFGWNVYDLLLVGPTLKVVAGMVFLGTFVLSELIRWGHADLAEMENGLKPAP